MTILDERLLRSLPKPKQEPDGMLDVFKTIDKMMECARDANPFMPEDYRAEDGFMYCGKCHTPKESRHEFPVEGREPLVRIVPVSCECHKAAVEEENRRKQEEKRMEELEKLRAASLMGERFKQSTFANFQTTPDNEHQLGIAQRYVQYFGQMKKTSQSLLFYGDTGTGKTYLAACIANALMENGVSVMMTSLSKLMAATMGEKRTDVIQRMNKATLLIIDDLGVERSTDTALEAVYDYIDSRYQTNKPMILTTNLTMQEMRNTTDIRYKRIYDRIFQICHPVEFTGKSWRTKEAAKRYTEMKQLLEGAT